MFVEQLKKRLEGIQNISIFLVMIPQRQVNKSPNRFSRCLMIWRKATLTSFQMKILTLTT